MKAPIKALKAGALATVASAAIVTTTAEPVHAQNIDDAIKAYNEDRHIDAAVFFYDVIQNGNNPEARVKAEFYIGQSLYKAGYLFPAMRFYADVFNSGDAHPYFLKATEGLLKVAEDIGDDTLIPEVINKGYTGEFAKLNQKLDQINYLIGTITQRRGNYDEARDFLSAVSKKSGDLYVKARYLLAVLAVKTAAEKQADSYEEAIKYFSEIESMLATATDDTSKKLYRLAVLGKARAYYSQGDWKESVDYYEKVPRFSDDWYDAMYESGWAYFQNGEFGKALGMVHGIQSPYFDERYRAESWVLKATTYFQMCHFDRGRKALDSFFAIYEPMSEQIKKNWLEGEQTDEEILDVIMKGDPRMHGEIRNQILQNRRFKKFYDTVTEASREMKKAEKEIPEGALKAAVQSMLGEERESRVALAGKLAREQLKRESAFLDDFINQSRIIKFEIADGERRALELGFDITKGPRAKGPRPFVPSSRYQYWAFLGEYWIDELGYYQHSIKDECGVATAEKQ
ncbi:MAG: tetratricopeptide repeat protein [Deltaproteobacteria bacterium]|nr:tetratricopeptide repeat protein [Deltaproteobacteria bacterium]